jgi:broad specificity phosphatase PhoE
VRARRTAAEIAQPQGLEVEIDERFVEIDFGVWTGAEFAALAGDPAWERWNRERSLARCPAGEAMADVQRRAIDALDQWVGSGRGAGLAVVSHGDVIRAVLAWYLGLSLDHLLRIEISPASVTVLDASAGGARVLALNHTGELPDL